MSVDVDCISADVDLCLLMMTTSADVDCLLMLTVYLLMLTYVC